MSARLSLVERDRAAIAFADLASASHFQLVGALRVILTVCQGPQSDGWIVGNVEMQARIALDQVEHQRADWTDKYIAHVAAKVES